MEFLDIVAYMKTYPGCTSTGADKNHELMI